MFSSKSTTLIAYAKRYALGRLRCVIVKYRKDARYSCADEIVTHDTQRLPATVACERLAEVDLATIQSADAILVDEGQFFCDLATFCDMWASTGKIVIVAALDGDFRREPWPQIAALLPKVEHVEKLHSVCSKCGEDGSFTKRLVSDDQLELIGGPNLYDARCRLCFHIP
jgi:thymidine kinase